MNIDKMSLAECIAYLREMIWLDVNRGNHIEVIDRIHELTRWNNIVDSHPPKGALYEVCGVESGQYWRYYTKP